MNVFGTKNSFNESLSCPVHLTQLGMGVYHSVQHACQKDRSRVQQPGQRRLGVRGYICSRVVFICCVGSLWILCYLGHNDFREVENTDSVMELNIKSYICCKTEASCV